MDKPNSAIYSKEELDAALNELSGLRHAVALMGFDPATLAAFMNDDADHVCKQKLMSSMDLNEDRLRENGGIGYPGWKEWLAKLKAHRQRG